MLNLFSPESEISLRIKQKKKKNILEVRKKARNVFVMSLRLSYLKVSHNIASSSSSFDFARIFSVFLARISYFQTFGV